MKRETREEARTMRREGKAIGEIATALEVSRSSVSTWVRDIALTEQQKAQLKANQQLWGNQNAGAQVNREKAKEKRVTWQLDGRKKAHEKRELHLIGCMLYWAEGAKSKNGLYFANSDPFMLLLFIRFLREELDVKDSQIKLLIHCHRSEPEEISRIENYWLALLNLSPVALSKTQIKKGSDTRKNILKNGVCSIRVYSTELAQHIYGAIQEYGGFDNPEWLF